MKEVCILFCCGMEQLQCVYFRLDCQKNQKKWQKAQSKVHSEIRNEAKNNKIVFLVKETKWFIEKSSKVK